MWGANEHTVTQSSELLPCNKTSDSPFASGEQNQGFTFSQVVNNTDPTFYYCGTPGHCEKGMFGIINPPTNFASPNSVGNSLPMMASNNSNIAAMSAYSNQACGNNQGASSWGSSIDMSNMPSWAYQSVVENTMYTRTFLAANPDVLNADGSISLSASGSSPLMFPQDITSALASASNSTSTTPASNAPAGSAAAASVAPSSASGYSNGASSVASPRLLIAAMTVAVTFFAL
jgi:hypothetical protein